MAAPKYVMPQLTSYSLCAKLAHVSLLAGVSQMAAVAEGQAGMVEDVGSTVVTLLVLDDDIVTEDEETVTLCNCDDADTELLAAGCVGIVPLSPSSTRKPTM